MTKKDYELIAGTLRNYKEFQLKDDEKDFTASEHSLLMTSWREVGQALATNLQADNPRFDRNKFLTACGIKD